MTGTFGDTGHYAGDGCTGQERPIAQAEKRLIGKLGVSMITAVLTPGVVETAATLGRHIAVHYGPYGEFYLAGRLAEHVIDTAPCGPRPDGPAPDLRGSVADCDPAALDLLAALARKGDTPSTQTERCEALNVSAAPLQTFMKHMHARRFTDALAQWHAVYGPDATLPPLAALGFTAQLVTWAAKAIAPYSAFAARFN